MSSDHNRSAILCNAIRTQTLLAFDYGSKPRVVAPYCHGHYNPNDSAMRTICCAVQQK